ncbi:hypothetical protein [uncultured Mucilaginibacter sp.]|uniref:hypothetical protein n=1 Tax=uncultured Mucilaginibacter sp. TaxID=797541 RepID=UPI0025D0F786|nr:hypothetical protein [uncultured Mucilaginibacter sp.]
MKSKIFNIKLLLICGLLIAAQGGFAQKNKNNADKEFDKQMGKLQEQMRDLQKQMSKIKAEKIKQKTSELGKLTKELSAEALARLDDSNFANLNGLSRVYTDSKILNITAPRLLLHPDGVKIGQTFTYNWTTDEKKLAEMVQSGELKEKSKTYTKSYSANGNDKLLINNSYGKVTVNTWAKNEIKVDVQMKAYADEDEDAQKLLDKISISDSKESSLVSFKTNIERSGSNGTHGFVMGTWLSGGKKHVSKMEVNYTIYMPAKSQLDITNKFGNVVLPDMVGKVNVNLAYGALISQDLNDPAIKVSFGDARINNVTNGNLHVSYGNLNLGMADNLKAKVSFGGMNVDKLKSSGVITARYGDGIKITELDRNCKNINVDAQFTKVYLPTKSDYDFDVTTHFGEFNYDNSTVKVISQTPDNGRHFITTKTFKGQVNKGNSDKVITIKSSYATVKLD